METAPGDGSSFLKLPLDTEARTLFAWPGVSDRVPPAP
nr:MAG TPA: hypothetical protein [Caudoviricetes sp.]